MVRLNQPGVYVGLSIIGGVIAALYWLVGNDVPAMFLWLFITVYCVAGLRFFLEFLYFRRHQAIPSTLQFVLLPYVILLVGSVAGPRVNSDVMLLVRLDVIMHQSFTMNMISLSLLVPFSIASWIFSRLHSRRWLGFAIRRSVYYSRRVPFLVHTLESMGLVFLMYQVHVTDIMALGFIIVWLYLVLQQYVFPMIKRRKTERNTQVQSVRRRPEIRNRLRSGEVGSSTVTYRANRSTRPSTRSRDGQRRVLRESKQERSKTRKPSRVSERSRLGSSKRSVEIDPGREVVLPSHKVSKIDSVSRFLPHAHVSRKDLSCTICYEEIKRDDGVIVLCPHCKFPMHESEFLSWMQMSNLCPRCSKAFSRKEIKSPSYRLNASEYVKVLKSLPK